MDKRHRNMPTGSARGGALDSECRRLYWTTTLPVAEYLPAKALWMPQAIHFWATDIIRSNSIVFPPITDWLVFRIKIKQAAVW